MKLLYVYIGTITDSSVSNKVVDQINSLNYNNIETKGVFFNSEPNRITNNKYIENIKIINLETNKSGFFSNYKINQNTTIQINQYLIENGNQFDYYFIRDFNVGYSKLKLLKKHKDKILLYVPSNTIRENYLSKKYWGKLGIVSTIFHWLDYFLCFYIWEWYNIKFIYSQLKSIVVFTNEFGEILNKKSIKKIKYIYNRDGVNCSNIQVRNYLPNKSDTIKLLFLKGSSTQQIWSGLDRLINSINNQSKYKFELFITGFIHNPKDYDYPFVKLVGKLNKEELNLLISNVDLGVSNLANYMINFNETTNLKTREYFACGLPFIQSNSMPDIDGTEGEQFYLKVENNSSLIDMNLVFQFANKMKNLKEHPLIMRNFAENQLDWNITCKEIKLE